MVNNTRGRGGVLFSRHGRPPTSSPFPAARLGGGQTLNSLGRVYNNQGRWEEAIACHEQSLAICRQLGDRHGEAQALTNLGNVYQNQGRWEEAIACYEQSLPVFRQLGDRHGEARTLNNLGLLYHNKGRW